MACKYKKFGNPRWCQVIWGECQFLLCDDGPKCPIYAGYPDWDQYWMDTNEDKDGVVHVGNIMTIDQFDPTKTMTVYADTINLKYD